MLPQIYHIKWEENHHPPTRHLKVEGNHQPDRAASQSDAVSCLLSDRWLQAETQTPWSVMGCRKACGCSLTSCKEQHRAPGGESTHISCRLWLYPQIGQGLGG